MTVIKINAITVPADSGDALGRRFAARAGAVDGQPGFEGFELLQPTDGRTTWLVVTRWADEASFEAWSSGQDFNRAHGARPDASATTGDSAETQAPHSATESQDEARDAAPQRPVGMSAELWSFTVSTGSDGTTTA